MANSFTSFNKLDLSGGALSGDLNLTNGGNLILGATSVATGKGQPMALLGMPADQSIPNITPTKINFTNVIENVNSFFNVTTNRIELGSNNVGLFYLHAQVMFNAASPISIDISIRRSGAILRQYMLTPTVNDDYPIAISCFDYNPPVDSYYEIYAWHNFGVASDIDQTINNTFFECAKLW